MYPLSVPWNSIHSFMCLQKISSIARYFRPVMWWTTHTYVWEEEKQKKQVMRLRVTVEDRYCNTLMTFDPSGSPNSKYFNLFWKPICDFASDLCWYWLSISHHLREIPHLSFRLLTFDLPHWQKVKYFIFFGIPKCDFILALCWYELSISHRLRDIPHLRFWLKTLTLQGYRRSNISTFLEAHVRFRISILLKRTLYLAPLSRYSTSKVLTNDLAPSGSPKVKYFNFSWKPMCDFIIVFCW